MLIAEMMGVMVVRKVKSVLTVLAASALCVGLAGSPAYAAQNISPTFPEPFVTDGYAAFIANGDALRACDTDGGDSDGIRATLYTIGGNHRLKSVYSSSGCVSNGSNLSEGTYVWFRVCLERNGASLACKDSGGGIS